MKSMQIKNIHGLNKHTVGGLRTFDLEFKFQLYLKLEGSIKIKEMMHFQYFLIYFCNYRRR
jgi:hypothetical protein